LLRFAGLRFVADILGTVLTFITGTVRAKHAGELSTLRDEAARLELRLAEERRERKQLEEQVTQAHAEHHSKTRDLEGELLL
jgi:DNA gyrase/topoisomerase IV subunit A